MAISDAQKRANRKYNQAHMRYVKIAFSPNEGEILDYLRSKGNMSGYVKELIKADMESEPERIIDVGEDLADFEEAPWE